MIQIENIEKRFVQNAVLKGINLEFKSAGIYSILGPNGSGKSTLLKSIIGLIIPNNGSITVNNIDISENWLYRNNIDYLPQIAKFPANLSVMEIIHMIKDLRNKPARDKELIELFNIKPYLNRRLKNLSGGSIQKVNIIIGLMFDNSIMILDEPTSGLDPISLVRLKKFILEEKYRGKIIIMSSHEMNLIEEISDEIIFILEGKIYFKGQLSELLKKQNQLKLDDAIAQLMIQNYDQNI